MKELLPIKDYSPVILAELDPSELQTGNWVYVRIGTTGSNGEALFRYTPVQLPEGWEKVTQFYYGIPMSIEIVKAVADGPDHSPTITEHVQVFDFYCHPYTKIVYRLNDTVRLMDTASIWIDIPYLHTLQNIYNKATGRTLGDDI